MKRATYRIVFFLLLGAIINVAVAWGCAAWSDPPTNRSSAELARTLGYWGEHETDRILLEGLGWNGREETPYVEYILSAMASDAPGVVQRVIEEYPRAKDASSGCVFPTEEALETRAGWPAFSLQGIVWDESPLGQPPQWRKYMVVRLANRPGLLRPNDGRWLPLRPIWPGFAVNTLIYATLGWLLFGGPFQVRRLIRHNRGLCTSCGYDLRHADHLVCPECGTPT